MSPTPRLGDFFRKINQRRSPSGDQRQTRITQEVIDQIRPDGRLVIRGYVLTSSGIKIDYKVGEVVNVAWNKDGVPQLVFGHNWRRSEFPEAPEEVSVTALEIAFVGEVRGQEGFFVVNNRGLFAIDTGNLSDDPIDVSWGENSNILLLRFDSQALGEEVFRVVRINRSLTSDTIPIQTDVEGEVQTLGSSEVPIIVTVTVSEHLVVEDVPIGQTVTVRENLTVNQFIDLFFDERFGQPNFERVITTTPKSNPRTTLIEFEQTFDMTILGLGVGTFGAGYASTFLYAFVNKSDELIQVFRLKWNIPFLFDRFDSEYIKEFTIDTIDEVSGPPLGANPNSFRTIDEIYALAGITGIPLLADALSAISTFGTFGILSTKFPGSAFPSGHNALESQGGFPTLALRSDFARVRIRPASESDFPGAITLEQDFFDVFAVNRTTETLVGASFTNPVFEWDREIEFAMASGSFRSHLDFFPSADHEDFLTFSRAIFTIGVISGNEITRINYPVEDPPGEVNFGSPFFFPSGGRVRVQLVKNFRFAGRGFGISRDDPTFSEENNPIEAFGAFSTSGPEAGRIIDLPEYSFLVDDVTLTVKTPDPEVDFLVPQFGDLVARLNLTAPVLFAKRTFDRITFLFNIQVFRWLFPSAVETTLASKDGISLTVEKLRAHDAAIYVRYSTGEETILLGGVERPFSSESPPPPEFDFIVPGRGQAREVSRSYTNNEEGDRRLYAVSINDEGGVVVRKTTEPTKDLLDRAEIASVGEVAFHFTGGTVT